MSSCSSSQQNYKIQVAMQNVAAFDVIGISVLTDNQRGAEDINVLWEQFFVQQIGQKIPDKTNDIIYAVYSDYEGDHTKPYRLTIGYRVPPDTQPTRDTYHVQVAAQDYAVIKAAGPQPQTLVESWMAVWQSDMPRSFKTDFESYGPRFFEEGVNEVLIHIGVTEVQTASKNKEA